MSRDTILILCVFSLLLISHQVSSQDACERIDIRNVLGCSDMLSDEGILSQLLTPRPGGPAGYSGTQTAVRILDMNIVCEAQHEMKDRYRYTSVVVSFNCFTNDTRVVPECSNSTVVNTEQFDLGCSGGTWTTDILSTNTSSRTTNPIATLTTEPDTGCILCINPASPVVGSRIISNVTHCEACSNCSTGLQRCYYDATFSNEECCNFFHGGVCVTDCPSPLAANPLNEFKCEMQCEVLNSNFAELGLTNSLFNGSVATLTCNNGYEVSNSPATCRPPNWSPTPACTPVQCNDVNPPENGRISYTNESRVFNSEARYTCNIAFVLEGPSTRTCSADGMWSPDIEPLCILMDYCSSGSCDDDTMDGNFTQCVCDQGLFDVGDELNCTQLDQCLSNPCAVNITCTRDGVFQSNYTCTCSSSFTDNSILISYFQGVIISLLALLAVVVAVLLNGVAYGYIRAVRTIWRRKPPKPGMTRLL